MSITGTIMNGVVVLPPGTALPEGTEVKVEASPMGAVDPLVALADEFAKRSSDLPDDLAANLDYYLHGHARKQQPRHHRWIAADRATPELGAEQRRADSEQLASMAAEIVGLPADLATNHDHYLHGLPKS
jgi:hypothetical protein